MLNWILHVHIETQINQRYQELELGSIGLYAVEFNFLFLLFVPFLLKTGKICL